jgi:uncharacterized protein (TIGR03435 family)
MYLRHGAAILAFGLLIAPSVGGQQPAERLEFEVASIKENREPGAGGILRFVPSGAVTAQHFRARSIVEAAYSLKSHELLGTPDWASTTYYDINAKPAGTATREQQLAMLRSLLADRFNFAGHRETRTFDGYALQRVRTDGLGPNLRRATLDCIANIQTMPQCREGRSSGNTYQFLGYPLQTLVAALERATSAPVVDESGLAGLYDIDLRWSTDAVPLDDVPGIFTAIQEQLGLKLERRRMERAVLVVDRMEKATPD